MQTDLSVLWHWWWCSVAKSCPTLCNPMDCSTPGFPVLHCLLEFAHIRVHWVDDAIQPSHPLPAPSPFAFSLSQHPGPLQWVSSSHHPMALLSFKTLLFFLPSCLDLNICCLLTLLTAPLLPSWGQKNKTHHMISVPLNHGNFFCGQRLVYLEMSGVHSRRMYMLPLLRMHMLP